MKRYETLVRAAYFALILILVLVMIYSGLQILESTVFSKRNVEIQSTASKTITRDGVEYFPRQDITVLLLMGIDQFGVMEPSEAYNNGGAVDMVSLVVFDETEQECRVLALNRDTMVDIPVLGIGGRQADTVCAQLALSYSYGSGMEDSSENVRKAVSDFLYGLRIDQYITLNMDAVSLLNDSVGGVTITITDDFSKVDPSLKPGRMTLHGDQAIHFVRARGGVGDQLNISRMERQKIYMSAFLPALRLSAEQSTSYAISAYDEVSDYMVTDCSSKVLSSMLDKYKNYPMVEIITPAGSNSIAEYANGERHYEFTVDEKALDALILRLFYAPKN